MNHCVLQFKNREALFGSAASAAFDEGMSVSAPPSRAAARGLRCDFYRTVNHNLRTSISARARTKIREFLLPGPSSIKKRMALPSWLTL